MRKDRTPQEMTLFNRAAFQIGAEALRGRGLELLLDEALAQVTGGLAVGSTDAATCTEFNCNLYAPPPPPAS
jgi:hypothetical protein